MTQADGSCLGLLYIMLRGITFHVYYHLPDLTSFPKHHKDGQPIRP